MVTAICRGVRLAFKPLSLGLTGISMIVLQTKKRLWSKTLKHFAFASLSIQPAFFSLSFVNCALVIFREREGMPQTKTK